MGKNFKYSRTTKDFLNLKGKLNSDATVITVETDKEVTKDFVIADYLNKFSDEFVTISVSKINEAEIGEDE